MDKLIALFSAFGSYELTPKGLTIFDPAEGDLAPLKAEAKVHGYEAVLLQPDTNPDGSIKQYYDKKSNSMKDSCHMLQLRKPKVSATPEQAAEHLANL